MSCKKREIIIEAKHGHFLNSIILTLFLERIFPQTLLFLTIIFKRDQ